MSIALLTVLAIGLLIFGLGLGALLFARQLQKESMEERFAATTSTQALDGGAELWGRLAQHGRRVDALFDEQGETEMLLLQAGLRTPTERIPYFVAQLLVPFSALGIWFAYVFVGDASSGAKLIYGFGAVALGLLAPRFWLRRQASRRRAQLRAEVPMLIHLLALLFDAGLSLRQALATLTTDGGLVLPQISRELGAVLRQLETGAEVGEVMRQTGRMLDVTELASVLSVLQQVDRYGGELRVPLMDVLELVEKRRELGMREKVSELSGRMTVVMVLFFFPALLIFVAGPAFLAILGALSGVRG